MKKFLISFVILLFILGAFASLGTASSNAASSSAPLVEVQAYWINQTSTITVTPGMDNIPLFAQFVASNSADNGLILNLSIGLNYNGTGPLNYSYVHGLNGKVVDYTNYVYEYGMKYTAYQLVNISARYKSGIYTESLNYILINGTAGTVVSSGKIPFQVVIPGDVNERVSATYFTIGSKIVEPEPGLKDAIMHIVMENAGIGYATNVTFSFKPSMPFYGSYYNLSVPAVTPFSLINLTVPVNISSKAAFGSYDFSVNVTYSGTYHNITGNLKINGYNSLMMVGYHTNPPIIYRGDKFIKLNAVFLNNGTSPIYNANVNLRGPFKTVAGNFTDPLIMPGSQFNGTFYFNAPYTSGKIMPEIKVGNYTYMLSIRIHEGAIIHVSDTISSYNPGQSKALMVFNFTNTGNRTAYDIQIHLLSPSIMSIHVSSSNPLGALTANNLTIGSLAPDSSFIITFIVDISSSAPIGYYNAQLAYSYMYNDSAQRYNGFNNFQFHVVPTEIQKIQTVVTPSNIIFDAAILVLLVVILALLLVAAKRRKGGRSKVRK